MSPMYYVEFNDQMMRYVDYLSVSSDVCYLLCYDDMVGLRDYVEAMGYEWERVAYMWEVAV